MTKGSNTAVFGFQLRAGDKGLRGTPHNFNSQQEAGSALGDAGK